MVAGPVTTGTANIFIENTNTTNIIYIYLDTLSTSAAIMSLFVNTIRDMIFHHSEPLTAVQFTMVINGEIYLIERLLFSEQAGQVGAGRGKP